MIYVLMRKSKVRNAFHFLHQRNERISECIIKFGDFSGFAEIRTHAAIVGR